MTLALTVDALDRLYDPAATIGAASEWAAYVGVVAERANAGLEYTRERRIRPDFFSGTRSVEETLHAVRGSYQTERYVLVGTTQSAEVLAGRLGWEFEHVSLRCRVRVRR
jgi:hypothetical protein